MEPVGESLNRIEGVDLHLHSLASDGTLTPAEVVAVAAQRGLKIMALTDHDTTLGIPSALMAAQEWGVEVIPGIEMTAEEGEELHILGYFIDAYYPPLQVVLLRLRQQRSERARRMLELLAKMGMPLDWADVIRQTWSSVGRPHVARTLLAEGYVSNPREAFDLYLDPGRPAYVHMPRPSVKDTCDLIRATGGIPVLAHPIIPGRDDPTQRLAHIATLLPALKEAGMVGLEAYYPEYSPEVTRALVALAESHDLVPIGGSDFHGPNARLAAPRVVAVPYESVERLRAAASALRPKSQLGTHST